MAKILIVDDDPRLAESMRAWLYEEGHTIKILYTGDDAQKELEKSSYDIVLLDIVLPDMSGFEVCRNYRAAQGSARVLMITGKGAVDDKESGLDSGADDYIVKPFDLKELSARVRALMRRSITISSDEIVIDEIVLNSATMQVFRAGVEIKLLPQEFALLEFLMKERNKLFDAETLLQRLWRGAGSEGTVRTHIKCLRKKLDKNFDKQFIRTVHGVGYGFTDL